VSAKKDFCFEKSYLDLNNFTKKWPTAPSILKESKGQRLLIPEATH
jgi:hypothetical protein